MPGPSGLEAVPRLLAVSPASHILMLSVHDNTEYVLQAVRAGAHGYLRKDTTPAELRQAVHAVHKGDAFFSPTAARHLTQALRGEGATGAPPVSGSRARTAVADVHESSWRYPSRPDQLRPSQPDSAGPALLRPPER